MAKAHYKMRLPSPGINLPMETIRDYLPRAVGELVIRL